MKYLYLFLTFLGGCQVATPRVLADTTRPSVMEETIKQHMTTVGETSYFWILWYVPIAVVIFSWTWKTFFRKEIPNESKREG